MIRHLILILVLLICQAGSYGNNIQVSNVQLVGQNTAANTYQVQFDLSWENSWRTSTLESNWDAAWVFIKFSKLDFDVWNHATLTLTGAVAPSGATLQVVDNAGASGIGVGAFIYRSANGQGSVNYTGVQLQWNYGANGIADNELVEVCVQAIEMVFVPQGSFYLGDGAGTYASFESANSGTPILITSENTPYTLGGSGPGSIGNNDRASQQNGNFDDFGDNVTQILPATYPIGYDAFYCMKYEVSQEQFTSFLNKLTTTQRNARYTGNHGPGYQIDQNGTRLVTMAPAVACTYLRWADLAAFLDWAGLRPMSETEFEKACRGTRYAVLDEFAWGNASLDGTNYNLSTVPTDPAVTITNAGDGVGCAAYPATVGGNGPLRCGIFAASSVQHDRQEAGASYWGILELSGNAGEQCVTLGIAQGRTFTGLHGNGALTTNGNADVSNWPILNNGVGGSIRGGAWTYQDFELRTSMRKYANTQAPIVSGDIGGRGVRTAP